MASRGDVIFQKVRIKTPQADLQRAIYRDSRGKRQAKKVSLEPREERVKANLTAAGVEWDAPLSAGAYQEWHDRQHVRDDSIERTGSHLLRLRTEVPQGPVMEQTLTVRDSDFHPVQRTIEFRDNERVEIAELDYKVLPWSAVDQSVFEPLGGLDRAGRRRADHSVPSLA